MGARSTANVYQPAAGDVVLPGATAIHEFFGFTADCGQAAAEIIYAWAHGQKPSGQHINAVVNDMARLGLGSSNGVSGLGGESQYLSQHEGIPNTVTHDWLGAIQGNAGKKPVELLVYANSLGAALPGDEFGVHGHFLTVEGFSPSHNAFIVSDPDNAAAKQSKLVYYTAGQLAAANPQGAIVPTGGGPGISGSGSSGNPILQGVLSNIPGVNLIAQAGGDASTAATNAGLPNPLDPATWLAGIKTMLVDTGFVVLALLVIVLGMLLVFWPQVKSAAGEGAKAARDVAMLAV